MTTQNQMNPTTKPITIPAMATTNDRDAARRNTVANIVTYTQTDADGCLHTAECRIDRPYRLTPGGALRIIRATGVPVVDVERIQVLGIGGRS
jgi:hypothetical protein